MRAKRVGGAAFEPGRGAPAQHRLRSQRLKDLEPLFFVSMPEKTYPGAHEWLIQACREAGFTPRILQDADREPAVLSFVAARRGCPAALWLLWLLLLR